MSKQWYRVDVVEGDRKRVLLGTSPLLPADFAKQLSGSDVTLLENLSYRDKQGLILPLDSWDPRLSMTAIYINPKFVTTVTPLAGDPTIGDPPIRGREDVSR